MGEKALEQLNIIIESNSNTALVVRRIKDDLIDKLDFRNNFGKSDLRYTNIASVLSERETESKQKNQEKQGRFHCLLAFRWIPNTKT